MQFLCAQCQDNANVWNDSWVSCETTESPNAARGISHWLLYEFAEPQSIGKMHIWNANKLDESHLGVNDVIIDFSIDGENWMELGDYQFPQADESNSYEGFDGPDFGGILVKKVLFTCLSNYNALTNECMSLAEVQFEVKEKDLNDDEVSEIDDEIENDNDLFVLYPNPFTSEITLKGNSYKTVRIFDMNSKELLNEKIGYENKTLDLSSFSTGFYLAIVTLESKTTVIKIVKE